MSMDTPRTAQMQADAFARLIAHPAIAKLADQPRWTLITPEKVPIDMLELKNTGRIVGCNRELAGATTTLHEILSLAPAPLGCAFYLESDIDEVCVLDIEPECEDELKDTLAATPTLYHERSLSGQGYHLLLPTPDDILAKYPASLSKKVIKANGLGWEVLFEHWVTFTAMPYDQSALATISDPTELFASELDRLARGVQETPVRDIDYDEVELDDIRYADDIIAGVLDGFAFAYRKTPDDFDGDASRYEFSLASTLYRRICDQQSYIHRYRDPDVTWSDSDDVALTAAALMEYAPYREKHDTLREGLPWLVYTAMQVVMKQNKEKRL